MGTSYTEKQRDALRKYYPDGNYEVLSKWFPGKTKQQISAAANRIGLKRNHPGYQIDRTGQQYGQLTVLGFDHWRPETQKAVAAARETRKTIPENDLAG